MERSTIVCFIVSVSLALISPMGHAQSNGDDTLFKDFAWQSIGPVNMSGRIDDVEAVESNPRIIYIGAATGGVWKTVNNGTTWTPIFDEQPNISIGDIAIAPSNPAVVWVGTGEPNNRQSSSYGAGIFKTTDGGATWAFMGLGESGAIGRIVIDPKDPNVVYVAAVGHLYKAHPERGLFKTVDGGRTWSKSKEIDQDTGFTEIVMHPLDNRILFAASYQRRRTAFGFNGGGPGAALWKTTNAGQTWTKVEGGLPSTGQWGRTGLAIHRANPRIVYALIQPGPAPQGPPMDDTRSTAGAPDPRRDGLWRSDDTGATWKIVSNFNGRPSYLSQIRVDARNPQVVYVLGRQAYKSTDGAKTFEPMGDEPLFGRGFAPDAKGRRGPAHVDHHALWLDPNDSDHLILGHDGGVDFSYDGGRSWEFQDKMALGQFYEVAVDMRRPYYVYGGAQDRGLWGGPSQVMNVGGITKADWFMLQDGDGFHVKVDPMDWATIYARVAPGGGGTVWRFDLRTGAQKYIRPRNQPLQVGPERHEVNVSPKPEPGETYRFNWNTPIAISPHNPRVVYYGGHRLFKSYDRGDTWIATKDLSKALDRSPMTIMGVPNSAPMTSKNDGVSQYGTIVAVAESPVAPGVLWVGTDDGNLQVSRDDGATWTNVADRAARFEQNYYVETVEPSHFDAGTAYVGFDGHYWGDFKPHIFKTTDYGATWTNIGASLPAYGHINVIREDPKNPRLLYAGTETGFYVSLDAGQRWVKFMNNLPAAPTDDLVVHPREQDLVIATHGRSFYILDDITPLQQLTPEVLSADAHLFTVRDAVLWNRDIPNHRVGSTVMFRAQNPPEGATISYYLKAGAAADVKIELLDPLGAVIRELRGPKEAGLHRVQWDLRRSVAAGAKPFGNPLTGETLEPTGALVAPGEYVARLTLNGRAHVTKVRVESDPTATQP